jgi:hypothetical protein
MGICVFKTDDVVRCIVHTLLTLQPGEKPQLCFVHDQGVYLMSNNRTRDLKNPTDPEAGVYVAYAEGCDPTSGAPFDEWYGNSRELVGGDDFGEFIDIDANWLRMCSEFSELCFNVMPTDLEIYAQKPKKREKPHAELV